MKTKNYSNDSINSYMSLVFAMYTILIIVGFLLIQKKNDCEHDRTKINTYNEKEHILVGRFLGI